MKPCTPLASAVALLCFALPLDAAFAQEVTIGRDATAATDELVLEVFEFGAVVDPQAHYPGVLHGEDGEPLSEEELAERSRELRQNLLDDVRRWIEPPLEKGHTLRMTDGGALIAHVPEASAEWLRAFAELQWRHMADFEGSTTLFDLETSIYQAHPDRFDPLGIEEQTRLFAPDEPFDPRALNIDVLTAPRLTVFASQPANVSIINQVAYIKEYRHVVVAPGNQELLDPIVDVVEDGVSIDTRVVPLPGGKVGVVLDAKITELQRPIQTVDVTIHEGQPPVQVGMPEVHRIDLVTRVRLAPGETLLITGRSKHSDGVVRSPFVFNSGKDAKELALSLRVNPVDLEMGSGGDEEPEEGVFFVDETPADGRRGF